MDPVVHFEMPYEDAPRVAKFYQAAFGWKMQNLGEKMGDYVMAYTGPTTRDGMIKERAMINGGFFRKKPEVPQAHPSVVIAVKDLVRSMERVTASGGAVLGEPMDIPGIGAFVSFRDSEGNQVGMLQPLPRSKPPKNAATAKNSTARAKKRPPAKRKPARR